LAFAASTTLIGYGRAADRKKGDTAMEYVDIVRTVNQAYWQSLLENDAAARQFAADLAERFGFQPQAADTMIEEFSRQPLQEWLAQQSGA
jgi:hypothetical protein